ncbi:tetratricopeptide repeat protein [Bacteroidota bacterium]
MINRLKSAFQYYFILPVAEIKSSGFKLIQDANSSFYRLLFASTFLFLLFFMPIISLDFARSTDETFSESYGQDILNYYSSWGEDKSVFDLSQPSYKDLIYYGLSFDFFCAVINRYLSPFGDFETRHFLNALMALLGLLMAALIGKKYANWRTAWLILIIMVLTPPYFAHSMNNAKDIPMATGYIASIFFMLRFLEELPEPRKKSFIFLILAIGFTSSVRIGGLILLAYLGLFMGVKWLNALLSDRKSELPKKTFSSYLVNFIIVGVFSYFLAILFWPFALQAPIKNPIEALQMFEQSDLMMTHYELFEGKLKNMANVPWYYIFKYLWITLPIGVLIGALSSLKVLWKEERQTKILVLILLFVTIFPILYAAYKGSKLYNGWRHFLFIYPGLALLAALGWNFILKQSRGRVLSIGIPVILFLLFLKPAIWMVKNHPFQAVYFNEMVGGINGAYGQYETDYLSFSGRKAAEWLAEKEKGGTQKIVVATNIETQSLDYYARKIRDSIQFVWVKPMAYSVIDWDYMIVTSRSMSHTQIQNGQFPPKGTIHVIKVDDTPICAIVKKENDYKYQGFKLFMNADYDSSLYYLEKAINYDPNDPEALTLFGTSLSAMKQYSKAEKMLFKSISIFPENFFAYDQLGILYLRKKDNQKALGYLRKCLSLRVNYANVYTNLGGVFQNLEVYDSALFYYAFANEYTPNNPEVEIQIANCLAATEKYENALALFNKVLSYDPSNNIARKQKAALENYLQTARKFKTLNKNMQGDLDRAQQFMESFQYDSVMDILGRVLKDDPQNLFALINRGVAYLNTGKYQKAQIDLEKAKLIDSNTHYLFYNLGLVYANLGKFNDAIANFTKAIEISPEDVGALLERAKTYIRINNFQEAMRDCNTLIKINNQLTEALYTRAWLNNNRGKKDLALKDLNTLLELNPEYAVAYNIRSHIYYEKKEYKLALNDLQKAKSLGINTDPRFEEYLKGVAK